jgi:hypothetical protein
MEWRSSITPPENILKPLNSENDLETISSLELINYEPTETEVNENNILEQASIANESVLEKITIVQGKINKNKKLAVSCKLITSPNKTNGNC